MLLIVSNLSLVSSQCNNPVNENPIITEKPRLLNVVSNGQKYVIQEGTNVIYIVNVHGSPYEMGQAYGQLMATEVRENLGNMFEHLE